MNGSSVFAIYHGCQQFVKTHLTLCPLEKSNNLKQRFFEILVQGVSSEKQYIITRIVCMQFKRILKSLFFRLDFFF
jgi:hypothetical protein